MNKITLILIILLIIPLVYAQLESDTPLIRLKLLDNITTKEIKITNTNEEPITINSNYLNSIILQPKETKEFTLEFEKNFLGLKTDSLMINNLKIPIILESETKEKTFNNILTLESNIVNEELNIEIETFTLKNIKRANIELTILIKDFSNNLISEEKEKIIVTDKQKIQKTIKIPSYLKPDSYVVSSILNYNNQISISTETFSIEKPKIRIRSYLLITIVIILILMALIKVIHDHKHLKKIEIYQKKELVKIAKIKSKQQRTNKLKKQLSLLEQAYSQHYISKNSYLKTKNKINKLLKK